MLKKAAQLCTFLSELPISFQVGTLRELALNLAFFIPVSRLKRVAHYVLGGRDPNILPVIAG